MTDHDALGEEIETIPPAKRIATSPEVPLDSTKNKVLHVHAIAIAIILLCECHGHVPITKIKLTR